MYFRIMRNEKWQTLKLNDLTCEEMKIALEHFDREALIRVIAFQNQSIKNMLEYYNAT